MRFSTILMTAVFFAAVAAGNLLFFNRQAQKSRKIENLLGQMEGYVNRLNTLEWQAMAKEKLEQGARESLPTIRRVMEGIFKTIVDSDGESQAFQKFKQSYGVYREAIELEFSLLAEGKIQEARDLDKRRVDPSYEALLGALSEAASFHNRAAQRAQLIAQAGSILIAVIALGFFLLRFERARGYTRALEAEQNALRHSEERFRSLVENASNVIAIVDPDAAVRYVSDSSLGVVGCRPDELTGKALLGRVHAEDREKLEVLLSSCAGESRAVLTTEVRFKRSDGDWRTIEIVASNRLADPAISGIVITFSDITERVRAAEALAQKARENNELYEQVKHKVKELQEKTDELERANQVKNQFLNVMSHELRTPLNVVLGYAGMITEGILGEISPEQRSALEKVTSHTQDLLNMITGILYVTSIEAQDVHLKPQRFALAELLNEIRAVYDVPQSKPLVFSWEYGSDLPEVETDREKLKHILESLIQNAIKFTDKGFITISARTKLDNTEQAAGNPGNLGHAPKNGSGKSEIEFRVADTGIGIADEKLPLIFEMFRLGDSSETRLYGGIGLGLYIAKNFTEMLGGEIHVETEPGKGSVFIVTIPCEIGQAEPSDAPDNETAQGPDPRIDLRPRSASRH